MAKTKATITYKKFGKSMIGVDGAASGTIQKTFKGFQYEVEGPRFVIRGVGQTLLGVKRLISAKVNLLGGF